MKIFLSWSGERSRSIASFLKEWLPRVIQTTRPWLSDRDIEKGEKWSEAISQSLSDHSFGIVCVTPENSKAPWLLFEAGALSKSLGNARICPVLFGLSPSELRGPLGLFQATLIEKANVLRLLQTINGHLGDRALEGSVLEDAFERFWPDFERHMESVAKISIPGGQAEIDRVLKSFSNHGLPEPILGGEACFDSGFESHGLYTSVMEAAQSRLLVFGRKNRKVFDKEHREFFEELSTRISAGFDFRVMFLNPKAPSHVLSSAHQDADFSNQLADCINRSVQVLTSVGVDPSKHCRMYTVQRTTTLVIVDDALAYAPVRIGPSGQAESITKSPFTIVSGTGQFGRTLVDMFEEQWEVAEPIT